MSDTLAIIMAGGKGTRLHPLTLDRSKPSVPFGGIYRLIDLTLSNCVNSGIYKIMVLPQYKSQSLVEHIEAGWNLFSFELGHYLRISSPQQRLGDHWYQGTADSVRQNTHLIERDAKLKHVLILSGDHVYKMDYAAFCAYHEEKGADVTISVIEVDRHTASSFGVAEVDQDFNIQRFHEKPKDPVGIPGDPEHALASMGIYVFRKELLMEVLNQDSGPDFGHNIIPSLLDSHKVVAYPFRGSNKIQDIVYRVDDDGHRQAIHQDQTKDSGYWRDVGTLDAYWNANMDLCGVDPYFNLYGQLWPIRTYMRQFPPVKTVFQDNWDDPPRVGRALDSLVSQGCIIIGATVRNSVLSPNVVVQSWSEVDESVIMDDVTIGRHCRLKKVIIDKHNHLPAGTEIGMDPKKDAQRFTVTPRGITVVPKGHFQG